MRSTKLAEILLITACFTSCSTPILRRENFGLVIPNSQKGTFSSTSSFEIQKQIVSGGPYCKKNILLFIPISSVHFEDIVDEALRKADAPDVIGLAHAEFERKSTFFFPFYFQDCWTVKGNPLVSEDGTHQ